MLVNNLSGATALFHEIGDTQRKFFPQIGLDYFRILVLWVSDFAFQDDWLIYNSCFQHQQFHYKRKRQEVRHTYGIAN